jgi:hypothetical protein
MALASHASLLRVIRNVMVRSWRLLDLIDAIGNDLHPAGTLSGTSVSGRPLRLIKNSASFGLGIRNRRKGQ